MGLGRILESKADRVRREEENRRSRERADQWVEAKAARKDLLSAKDNDSEGYVNYFLNQVLVWQAESFSQLSERAAPDWVIRNEFLPEAAAHGGRRYEAPANTVLRFLYEELEDAAGQLIARDVKAARLQGKESVQARWRVTEALKLGLKPDRLDADKFRAAAGPTLARLLFLEQLPIAKAAASAMQDRLREEGLEADLPVDVESSEPSEHDYGPKPIPTLIRHPRDAELVAVDWMRYWGWEDATATPQGADEGIDVMATHAVAQVKAHMTPVGRPDIQKLFGISSAEQKAGLFFSLSGYTSEATAWAEKAGVGLFRFDLQGEPQPENEHAQTMIRDQRIRFFSH